MAPLKPDDVAFPEFTPALGEAMVEEATSFFGRIVREDRSLLEILDSDYTYLNEDLAKHYGIDGVVGREQRLVEFDEERRGGVLGMGAILTATSLPYEDESGGARQVGSRDHAWRGIAAATAGCRRTGGTGRKLRRHDHAADV